MDMTAWAAGFFEGEGCINKRSSGRYQLTVQQNNKESLEVFQRALGVGAVYGPYVRERKAFPGVLSTPYYVWRISKQSEVRSALRVLLPGLVQKRQRALEALG